ncbi:MAG: signal peptidase II [Ruminococcus sp.]|nr:signal peptidase II [Ruminococcus sp.]
MIFLYIAIIVVIPVLAEVIRYFVVANLKPDGVVNAVPSILRFVYSENRGVAFGMFQDGTVFFAITTSIVIIVAAIFLIKNYKKSVLFSVAASLIIGGGLGNLYERIVHGYVVDYLSLSFFPPICNFADYCITAGTVCLIVYLIFFSDWLKNDKKKQSKEATDEEA